MEGSEGAGATRGLSARERDFIRFLLAGGEEAGGHPGAPSEPADELRVLRRHYQELRRAGSPPSASLRARLSRLGEEGLSEGPSLWSAESGALRGEEGREAATGGRYRPLGTRAASRAFVEAWDDDLDRPVALRLSPGGVSPEAVLREAMLTSRLEHPGMPPVHECGLDAGGRAFFALRRPRGRSLQEVFELARSGSDGWSAERALDALRKACGTVAFAHANGVSHGGLGTDRVVVGDFGEVQVLHWLRAGAEHPPDPGNLQPTLHPELDLDSCAPVAGPEEGPAGEPGPYDPREDVSALGGMLRELLVATMARSAPAELVAICDKATSTNPLERYPNAGELADELRAYTEGRVVRAHGAGTWLALRKWIARHRSVAAVLTVTLVMAATGLLATLTILAKIDREQEVLVSRQLLSNLCERAEELWDREALLLESSSDWLSNASDLAERRLPRYQERLDGLRRDLEGVDPDRSWSPPGARFRAANHWRHSDWEVALRRRVEREDGWRAAGFEEIGLPTLRAKLPSLAEENRDGSVWLRRQAGLRAAGESLRARHALLEELVRKLKAFAQEGSARDHENPTEPSGVLADLAREVEYLRWLQEGFELEWGAAWRGATESIADPSACPLYRGLRIRAQPGLAPLGRDPRTGLWEFADLRTGKLPTWRPGEVPVPREEDALVLVLIPGSAELEPFFLSKFEMTQAQWGRHALQRSYFDPEGKYLRHLGLSRLHPAEQMSWESATWLVHHLRLDLPTAAEWEHAARGGGEPGEPPADGEPIPCAERAPGTLFPHLRHHRPVGEGTPNGYGLHDLFGNVSEWCRGPKLEDESRPVRGGSYNSGRREADSPGGRAIKAATVGLRPARRLAP